MRRARSPQVLGLGVLLLVVLVVAAGVLRATTSFERTFLSPSPEAVELFGWSAIQAGTTHNLLIGSPYDHASAGGTSAGAVYYVNGFNGAPVFAPLTPTPTPAASDQFGTVVAYLPADAVENFARIIVGAPGDDPATGTDAGAVYVFNATTGAYVRTVPGVGPGDGFGTAVAVLDDDLVVGAPWAQVGGQAAGAVYVIDAATGNISKTCPNPAPAAGDRFGQAVAELGTEIVVGAPHDDNDGPEAVMDSGSVYFFDSTAPGMACPQVGSALRMPTPIEAGARFGWALAAVERSVVVATPDLLVGAPYGDSLESSARGTAYLFDGVTRDLRVSIQSPQPGTAADAFGWAVAAVGSNLLVGAPEDDTTATNFGAVYLFDGSSGDRLETVVNPSAVNGPLFGWSVAAFSPSDLGTKLLVGAPFHVGTAQWQGAAHLYRTSCGNGVLDAGEACDDGATVNGDCCASTCQTEPDETECEDDTLCTTGTECQGGHCGPCATGTACTDPCGDPAVCSINAGARCVCLGTSTTSTTSSTSTSTSVTSTTTSTSTSSTAPPIEDQGVVSDVGSATEFLYTGPDPIQTGVAPGTIEKYRAAVLRGTVRQASDGSTLSGVHVAILDHPEFGETLSRSDGMFDLAVNGGGSLTVTYVKTGYLTAHRQVDVPWQSYETLPDVALVVEDAANPIFANSGTMQVAQGTPVMDVDGMRQATLLFPAGTTATLVMPDGSTEPFTGSVLSIHATEYTVAPNGPEAMPAPLPPNSGYTYAVELSADEVSTLGAASIAFDPPVLLHVQNFLGFPVGGAVPAGYYDRSRGAWVPSANGRVIAVLSVTDGLADVDTDGDAVPDSPAQLAALGITPDEQQKLAMLFTGPPATLPMSLWRVPIPHFTPWDCNWPFSPPAGAQDPNQPRPEQEDLDPESCEVQGSILACQAQTLGEMRPVTGTPFALHYRSSRVPGRVAARVLDIAVTGSTLPPDLLGVEVGIEIAGRVERVPLPALENQRYEFEWDGRDVFGRTVQGGQPATVHIAYVYNGFYADPASGEESFGRFTETATPIAPRRGPAVLAQEHRVVLRPWDARGHGLGGWTLNVHHAYDPVGRILYLGDGRHRSATAIGQAIQTVAGRATFGFSGDDGPAKLAELSAPTDVAVGPDGSLYIADDVRVRRVDPAGIIRTVAGNGSFGYDGDNGLATQAPLGSIVALALGPDGSLYIADNFFDVVRRVDPANDPANGIITTVAGTIGGAESYEGDGGPATAATIPAVNGVAVGADGTLYITHGREGVESGIRQVSTKGIITTVVPPRIPAGSSGDGGAAFEATTDTPKRLSVGFDGELLIAEGGSWLVRQITSDGIIDRVAGGGIAGLGNGGPATAAELRSPVDTVRGPDGSLYISEAFDGDNRVRIVSPDGIINTLAGTGSGTFSGDGGPAAAASFAPGGLAAAPDGSVYVAANGRVLRIGPPLRGLEAGESLIPSEDGREFYVFTPVGRHLRTLEALTGAVRYTFDYDAAGRLASVTDASGNETTVERTGGQPTAIVAPRGQRTTLSVHPSGFLASIGNDAGETTALDYTPDGLLTLMTDARGHDYVFDYDDDLGEANLGRLQRDDDPEGGFQTLTRTGPESNHTVTRATAEGRTTSYAVATQAIGSKQRVNTFPSGLATTTLIGTNGTRTSTFSDSTSVDRLDTADPRFGMQAPVKSRTVLRPSNILSTLTESREVELEDELDPLSVISTTTTFSLNGKEYVREFTAETRTLTDITPMERERVTILDTLGRVVSEQVGDLEPTTIVYDSLGRVETITRGSGDLARRYTLTYESTDPRQRLETIKDPLDRIVRFTYDDADRVQTQILPDLQVIAYDYDDNGNVTSITPPGKPAHDFEYTDVDLEETYTPPPLLTPSGNTSFAYNLDRQLDLITRPGPQVVNPQYDPTTGRLTSLTTPTRMLTYEFDDGTGALTSIGGSDDTTLEYGYDGPLLTTATWGGPVVGKVGRTHDNNFRVTSTSVGFGPTPPTATFTFDDDGLLSTATGPAPAETMNFFRDPPNNMGAGLLTRTRLGVVEDARTYTSFGELATYTASPVGGGTPYLEVTYDTPTTPRDKLGRIVSKTESVLGGEERTTTYGYDDRGRLETVTPPSGPVVTYTYDQNGNRFARKLGGIVAESGAYDDQDRLGSYANATDTYNYTYTANGDLATKTVNGVDVTTYSYDALGNLLVVDLPDGPTIEYIIDAQNRRIGKKEDGNPVHGFLWEDQLRISAELDGGGNVVSQFVYGTRPNVPEYMVKNGHTCRIVTDHLGSPRLVIDVASGDVEQELDYDEFGRVTMDTNPGFQPFGFAGGLYDRDTGLVRFGARDYDATTGRWTTKDPIQFRARDGNLYAYVFNDPVNLIDPSGLSFSSSFAEGFVAGAASAAVVAGVALGAVALGVPAAAVTGTLFGVGVLGGALTLADLAFDPSTDNVARNLGALAGGSVVGGISGRLLACRLSPPGYQPPSGLSAWSPFRDASQVWRYNPSMSLAQNVAAAMATGPNPLSAAGAVASAGSGAAEVE